MPADDAGTGVDPQVRSTCARRPKSGPAGCSHAEVRVERIRSQVACACATARLETAADDTEIGVGLRVVHDGVDRLRRHRGPRRPRPRPDLADQAVEPARVTALAGGRRVELADEPAHGDVEWTAAHGIDPVTVPLADKVALLAGVEPPAARAPTASTTSPPTCWPSPRTSTTPTWPGRPPPSAGSGSTPSSRRCAVDRRRASRPCARWPRRPAGAGSTSTGTGGTGTPSWPQLPDLLAEKLRGPVGRGRAATTWSSTRPTSGSPSTSPIGHATELDRALGYEAAYAGTSFATLDQLGTLRYGSPVMHVTGDRTAAHGLATVAIDDEGVEGQSFDLVRDGVLVGYQLDRAIAAADRARAAPTAAPSPTRRCTSPSSAWPTCRCSRPRGRARPPRS